MNEGAAMTERISNMEIGRMIGLSHVQVHRIRTGSRLPSTPTMGRIEVEIGWSAGDQVKAYNDGNYALQFERAIERYAQARETETGPKD